MLAAGGYSKSIEEGFASSRINQVALELLARVGVRRLSVLTVEAVEWIGPTIAAARFQIDAIIVADNIQ